MMNHLEQQSSPAAELVRKVWVAGFATVRRLSHAALFVALCPVVPMSAGERATPCMLIFCMLSVVVVLYINAPVIEGNGGK